MASPLINTCNFSVNIVGYLNVVSGRADPGSGSRRVESTQTSRYICDESNRGSPVHVCTVNRKKDEVRILMIFDDN